jgi:hypothetical protein
MAAAAAGADRQAAPGRVHNMLQDLAALAPPAIVCAAFLFGAWVLVRRELAPKRRARRQGVTASAERAEDREQGGD